MNTLKLLVSKKNNENLDSISVKKIAEYISTRFMGVLTYFEQIFHNDNEKSLQCEAIESLGEIIRFMGSEHIINFLFKILAVLRTALTINDMNMKKICAKVWKIFIYTVDIKSLGSYLSLIVISLEPLLLIQPIEANEILNYLIISNGNLLSSHIANLFFLEDIQTTQEIKQCAKKHMDSVIIKMDNNNFMIKFCTFLKHINHEHLRVRIYALKYLNNLLEIHHNELHHLILSEQRLNSNIVKLLEVLMVNLITLLFYFIYFY